MRRDPWRLEAKRWERAKRIANLSDQSVNAAQAVGLKASQVIRRAKSRRVKADDIYWWIAGLYSTRFHRLPGELEIWEIEAFGEFQAAEQAPPSVPLTDDCPF